MKLKVAIAGYGNIGKYALKAVEAASDMECAGIIRRNPQKGTHPELRPYKVVSDIRELGEVDVVIICSPSRNVEEIAGGYLAMGINTVDSFDIHALIPGLRRKLDGIARDSGAVSIVSAGWDPGSDSVVRCLLQGMAPKGMTYTNFGPGRSMGHSVAAKNVKGVKDALSMTIPLGTGIHRRMVYVELEEGASPDEVSAAIKSDPYFASDETHVIPVESIASINDVGHGVNMIRKGVSGDSHNQLFEFNMKINNPALTGQILVMAARAALRQKPGCYTMIEIPPVDYLEGDREEIIAHLV